MRKRKFILPYLGCSSSKMILILYIRTGIFILELSLQTASKGASTNDIKIAMFKVHKLSVAQYEYLNFGSVLPQFTCPGDSSYRL